MLTTRIDLAHLTEQSTKLLTDLLIQQSQQHVTLLKKETPLSIEQVDPVTLQTSSMTVMLSHDIVARTRAKDNNAFRFEIIDHQKKIGEGGFSKVYEVMATIALDNYQLQVKHNKERVVKVINFKLEELKDILNEARLSRQAESLHIKDPVLVTNAEGDYTCYLVMHKLPGTDLEAVMSQLYQNLVSLSGHERLTISMKLLEQLAELHDKGIVHRDLKPENILMDLNSGKLTLFDFGVSKFESTDDKSDFLGTLGFIPFEVYAGQGTTFKSDVYAAAINIALLFYADEPEKSSDEFIEYQFDNLFKDATLDFTEKEKQDFKNILLQMSTLNAQERLTARQAYTALYHFRDNYVNRQIEEMAAKREPRYVLKKGLFFDKSKQHEPVVARPRTRTSCKF